MTTLAADSSRVYELGNINEVPVIATDIIYEGAAIGIVSASGHARPLTSSDQFGGFAEQKADNAAGSAADINVRFKRKGIIELSVSGAVITDIGQPVYATDDDTFIFLPTAAVFIGYVRRFVSAGKVMVEFDVDNYTDPYLVYGAPGEYETKSANYTLDIQDNAKVIFIDTDAFTITLPAVAVVVDCTIVNIGAFGTILVNVSPNAGDMIHAPDIAGVNDKDHLNTKATAKRGDLVQISSGAGDANGWIVRNQIGIWAQE